MMFPLSVALLALPVGRVISSPLANDAAVSKDAVQSGNATAVTTCNGKTYTYTELAGFGKLPSDARDKFGDTIGGIGSAIALDKQSWKKKQGSKEAYQGIIYGLPDRGWNTQGTQNSQSRIHKFGFEFEIVNATVQRPAQPNFKLTYLDTILLTDPKGQPLTGLDPTGSITFKDEGFPSLPLANCKKSLKISTAKLTDRYRKWFRTGRSWWCSRSS